MTMLIYLHTCGRCGARVRRHRQSTNAAWYQRHNLEAKAFPIMWYDASGSQDCDSPHARRERKERGEREIHVGPDARHCPSPDEFSLGDSE